MLHSYRMQHFGGKSLGWGAILQPCLTWGQASRRMFTTPPGSRTSTSRCWQPGASPLLPQSQCRGIVALAGDSGFSLQPALRFLCQLAGRPSLMDSALDTKGLENSTFSGVLQLFQSKNSLGQELGVSGSQGRGVGYGHCIPSHSPQPFQKQSGMGFVPF